jgi:hypothetical protein
MKDIVETIKSRGLSRGPLRSGACHRSPTWSRSRPTSSGKTSS